VVLRFNFRGVNLSEGKFDDGAGEMEDARVALAFLRDRYPDLPYSLAGFSFGARIAMRLACAPTEPPASRAIAVGFSTTADSDYLKTCGLPKHFVQSTHDIYGPKADLERIFVDFAPPKSLQFIKATDHFFAGALDTFESAIAALPTNR
jgi:alpha/beta superfamily hydrolase